MSEIPTDIPASPLMEGADPVSELEMGERHVTGPSSSEKVGDSFYDSFTRICVYSWVYVMFMEACVPMESWFV